MAKNLILGVNNNMALDYAGTNLVAMEPASPQWTWIDGSCTNAALTHGAGWVRATKTATGFSACNVVLKMLYDGNATITATLSDNGGVPYRCYGTLVRKVGTTTVATSGLRHPPYSTYVDTVAVAVPYYRYKFEILLEQESGNIGDWAQLDFALS